jgi:hypothetical protein
MKRKVTVMVPVGLMGVIDDVAKRWLGVGRNAFFCLGGMLLIAQLVKAMPQKKRLALLADLQTQWDAIMEEARKAA